MKTTFLPDTTAPSKIAKTPPLFWATVGVFVVLALIPTLWPEVDLATAGLFAGQNKLVDAGPWPWVVWINAQIPTVFRLILLAAFSGWILASFTRYGKHWRLQLAFVALAGTVGPGAVVNLVFKDNWQRARPYQVAQFGGSQQFTRAGIMTDQCDSNCSFVSGHVACGFFFASLMLVHRRRRIAWAATGVCAGLIIGFARMADVAHWLSDVLWAYPITLLSSWVVWKLLLLAYPPPSLPALGTAL